MTMHTTLSDWFVNHESNDTGNRNLQAFSNSLSLGALDAEKLQPLVKNWHSYFSCRCKQNHHDSTFPQELLRNKDPTRKQIFLHAWFRIPSHLHPHWFKNCTHKLHYHCSNGSRTFWLWDSPKRFKNSSSRRNWHGQLWRISNFNPWSSPKKRHPNVEYKRPIQIDPTHDKDSKRIRLSTDQEQHNSTRKSNYSLRQPQRLALRH
jgi:hypothetical protein